MNKSDNQIPKDEILFFESKHTASFHCFFTFTDLLLKHSRNKTNRIVANKMIPATVASVNKKNITSSKYFS